MPESVELLVLVFYGNLQLQTILMKYFLNLAYVKEQSKLLIAGEKSCSYMVLCSL